MIGLRHYDGLGLNGFGTASMEEMQQLNKALSAGYEANPALQVGGSALRVESLEESLKILTHTDRHIRFWRDIPKSPAFSTVEEFNQQLSYGDDGFGPWLKEGELPLANDSSYRRQTALVKYMGTTREVTHQVSLIHPAHGDLIMKENESGILWLLRQIEIALFRGDASLTFGGGEQGEQWNGLTNLIDPESFIDLEGAPPQEQDFEEISNLLAINFAFPTDCYTGYTPLSDLVKTMYPRHRINLPPPQDGQIGQAINSIVTQAGILRFNAARFIERAPVAPTAPRGPATHVPTAPSAIAVTFGASTVGEFDKSQGALDAKYAYVVTAANRFGESAPSPIFTSATLTGANAQAGYIGAIKVTNAATVTTPPDYFRIYRTVALDPAASAPSVASGAYSLIAQIPAETQANLGDTPVTPGTVNDINRVMPFTEELYVGELDEQVISFRQLAPLMKMDLAVLSPAYRWMILLYGVPILFAPKKWAKIVNIGRLGA